MLLLPASTLPAQVRDRARQNFELREAPECVNALCNLQIELQVIDRDTQICNQSSPIRTIAPGAMGCPGDPARIVAELLTARVLVESRKDPDGFLDLHEHALGELHNRWRF